MPARGTGPRRRGHRGARCGVPLLRRSSSGSSSGSSVVGWSWLCRWRAGGGHLPHAIVWLAVSPWRRSSRRWPLALSAMVAESGAEPAFSAAASWPSLRDDVGQVGLDQVGLSRIVVGLARDQVGEQHDGVGAGLRRGAVDVGAMSTSARSGCGGGVDHLGRALAEGATYSSPTFTLTLPSPAWLSSAYPIDALAVGDRGDHAGGALGGLALGRKASSASYFHAPSPALLR